MNYLLDIDPIYLTHFRDIASSTCLNLVFKEFPYEELLILHYCTRRSRPLSDAPSIETMAQHGNCQESHRYLAEGIAGELSNHFSSSAFRFISTPILSEIASGRRILPGRFYCCQDKRLMRARLRRG